MNLRDIKKCVEIIRTKAPQTKIEVSGNITLARVRSVALTGVDWISIGRLTHSVEALDLSLKIIKV